MHQGIIEGDFALCISLYHGYELLLQMGARSLFIYLCGIMDGSKGEMSSETFFLLSPLLLIYFTSSVWLVLHKTAYVAVGLQM